jgi:mannitol/fructose-specific phosphotransferase system IIA component (Ntr-type)
MRIEEISGRALVLDLRSSSAEAAFAELLDAIGKERNLPAPILASYLSAVVQRHRMIPCGLARGLAFPNARLCELSHPILAIGVSSRGLDLGGNDGCLSRVILLYLGRATVPADERQMLGRLSLALTDPTFAERLTASESADSLWEILRSIDGEIAGAVRGGGVCPTR